MVSRGKGNAEYGFTLLEALISAFIVAIFASSAAQIVITSAKTIEASRVNDSLNLCSSNIAREIQLGVLPASSGQERIGGSLCVWHVDLEATDVPHFVKYTVTSEINGTVGKSTIFKGVRGGFTL